MKIDGSIHLFIYLEHTTEADDTLQALSRGQFRSMYIIIIILIIYLRAPFKTLKGGVPQSGISQLAGLTYDRSHDCPIGMFLT